MKKSPDQREFIVGTRGSRLALTQTRSVIKALKIKYPKIKIKTIVISTQGDKITDVPLSSINSKSFFTKEIEDELLQKKIDFAVHSLKDLATELPDGLTIGAILKRLDSRDCLVSLKKYNLKTLPDPSKIGTSSIRRQMQLRAMNPEWTIQECRGNLDTRIKKLKNKIYDAIVIAQAGIQRLFNSAQKKGLHFYKIPTHQMFPCVGQGSLAIENRTDDDETLNLLKFLNHPLSQIQARAERMFLKTLQGGCQVPAGVETKIKNNKIFMRGILSQKNNKILYAAQSGSIQNPEQMGILLAKQLLKKLEQ